MKEGTGGVAYAGLEVAMILLRQKQGLDTSSLDKTLSSLSSKSQKCWEPAMLFTVSEKVTSSGGQPEFILILMPISGRGCVTTAIESEIFFEQPSFTVTEKIEAGKLCARIVDVVLLVFKIYV